MKILLGAVSALSLLVFAPGVHAAPEPGSFAHNPSTAQFNASLHTALANAGNNGKASSAQIAKVVALVLQQNPGVSLNAVMSALNGHTLSAAQMKGAFKAVSKEMKVSTSAIIKAAAVAGGDAKVAQLRQIYGDKAVEDALSHITADAAALANIQPAAGDDNEPYAD